MNLNACFDLGRAAAYAGKPRTSCPYHGGTPFGVAWLRGWNWVHGRTDIPAEA